MAPRDHFGCPFCISGAPWDPILALRDHPGGPWEQQDGHEVVNNRILSVLGFKMFESSCYLQACFQEIFLSISDSNSRRLGLPSRRVHIECIAKSVFSWKSLLLNSGMDVECFWNPWQPFF